jgi:hypothetical protein
MKIEIAANDHGAIYVFEVIGILPADLGDKTDTALMAVFGPVVLNTDYVDVVYPATLLDMTLPQYIADGYDMPMADEVDEDLRGLVGTAVLVMSASFGGQDVTLGLPENVRLVTTLREQPAIKVIDPISTASADGVLTPKPTKPPKSNARMSGMVAMYALLAMFALVGLMIWVGG